MVGGMWDGTRGREGDCCAEGWGTLDHPGSIGLGSTQAHGTLLWGPEGPAPHFSTTSNQLPTTSHLQDRAPRAVWLALVVGFSVLSDDSMPELS